MRYGCARRLLLLAAAGTLVWPTAGIAEEVTLRRATVDVDHRFGLVASSEGDPDIDHRAVDPDAAYPNDSHWGFGHGNRFHLLAWWDLSGIHGECPPDVRYLVTDAALTLSEGDGDHYDGDGAVAPVKVDWVSGAVAATWNELVPDGHGDPVQAGRRVDDQTVAFPPAGPPAPEFLEMISGWLNCERDNHGLIVLATAEEPSSTDGYGFTLTFEYEVDTDGDGVADATDCCPGVANAGQEDLDGDGRGDACDPDDDGDAVPDVDDTCPRVEDPDQTDTDADGQGDACDADDDDDGVDDPDDRCRLDPDPKQVDTDADGAGDACDPDDDDDGRDDRDDNCPLHDNEDQADLDGDGDGDVCDPDDDGDTVVDEEDNCPRVANTPQADGDGDGIGDLCADPATVDRDRDGLNDLRERELGTDPEDPDSDDDGSSDGEEVTVGTDPKDPDSDDDGLTDGEEVSRFGTSPTREDPDGDGDGWPDDVDNCPFVANEEQPDGDGDGVGDRCDPDDGNEVPDVPIHGLSLRGGGGGAGFGCATAGGVASGAWWVVAGLLLAGATRRRRLLRAMAGALLAGLLVAGPASAQDGALQIEQLEPQPAGSGILNVATSRVLPRWGWGVEAWVGYTREPLGLEAVAPDEAREGGALLPHATRAELVAAFGVLPGVELGLGLPATFTPGGGDLGVAGRTPGDLTGLALGDPRLVVNTDLLALLVRRSAGATATGPGVGLGVTAWLPVGDSVALQGEGAVRVEPRLAVDWQTAGGLVVAGNLAWHVRPESRLFNFVNDDVLRWGAAVSAPLPVHALEGLAVVHGAVHLADQPDPQDVTRAAGTWTYDPVEALAGLRWGLPLGFEVLLAGGAGLTSGIGAPVWRALLGVSWAAPADRGRVAWWAARDSDDDGVDDLADGCPLEPEEPDGVRDADGCPEAPPELVAAHAQPREGGEAAAGPLPPLPPPKPRRDTDGDGLLDRDDSCVDAAEDEDGFQDGDGCPDPDDDGDGIADAVDRCRREAETRDGVTDADGCPEGTPKRGAGMTAAGGADRAPADRDGDGLPDGKDRCPDVAETENGYEDEDGCPDTTPPVLVGISGVVDEIQFDLASARFRRGAIPILERVAGALAGNEALELVIAGHTDNQGNRDWNVDLSQLRADAVRHWLVHRGIDAGRIQSVGYGPDRPAASNDTPKGQAKNRRVELSYRERTDAGSGSRDGGQP